MNVKKKKNSSSKKRDLLSVQPQLGVNLDLKKFKHDQSYYSGQKNQIVPSGKASENSLMSKDERQKKKQIQEALNSGWLKGSKTIPEFDWDDEQSRYVPSGSVPPNPPNVNATKDNRNDKPENEDKDNMYNKTQTVFSKQIPNLRGVNMTYSNHTNTTNSSVYSNWKPAPSNRLPGYRSSASRGPGSTGPLHAKRSNSGGGGSHWYGVAESLKVPINFVSSVPSGITFDPDPKYFAGHSQLYLSQGSLFDIYEYDWTKLGTSDVRVGTTPKPNYFTNVLKIEIYYAMLRQIEKTRNRELGTRFKEENFYKYLDSVLQGLQIYYCLDSVFAYDRDASQFNAGMGYLRERISPDVVSEFSNLRRTLERQVMKPEIVDFIRFMYQNFKMHEGKHSPIIRLSYRDILTDGLDQDHLDTGLMIRTINQQINADFSGAFSYIEGGFPEWKLEGKLPLSTTVPMVDDNFNTWWHNQDVVYPLTTYPGNEYSDMRHGRIVHDEDSLTHYGVYGDTVDGVIHAASSLFVSMNDVNQSFNDIETGLWRPLMDEKEFRDSNKLLAGSLKFYNHTPVGGVRFQGSKTQAEVASSSNIHVSWYETTNDDETGFEVTKIFNTPVQVQRVLAHSVKMMKQSIYESVRYLLHP